MKIVHAEPKIKVSKSEALEIGKKDLANLVNKRKLVLLVDLDHTGLLVNLVRKFKEKSVGFEFYFFK